MDSKTMKDNDMRKQLSRRLNEVLLSLACFALATSPSYSQQPEPKLLLVPKPITTVESPAQPLHKSPLVKDLKSDLNGRALSIQDVVSIALAVNPDIVSAKESLMQAQGNTKSVASNQGLSVSGAATVDRYDEEQSMNYGAGSTVTQKQYSNSYSASVSLPIDVFGQLKSATNQAELQDIASRLNVLSVQNSTVLSVKSAFYDVLRDKALVQVAESDLKNAQANLYDAKQRLEAGTTTRYDVVSAESTVASSVQSLVSAKNTLAIAFSSLNNAIGVDIDTPLDITTEGAVQVPAELGVNLADITTGALPEPPPENTLKDVKPGELIGDNGVERASEIQNFVVSGSKPLGAEYDTLLKEAIRSRPEILEEDANVAAARKGIYVARKSGMPSLSAGYSYDYTPTSITSSGVHTGETTLTLSIPLYDSGYVAGKVTQARGSLSSAETARRKQIDSVTLEVRKAYMNLQEGLESLKSARVELAKADEGYRVARLRYSTGVTSSSYSSPILELSDAQKTLSTAQKDYVNALYDYNNDSSSLEKALGRYSKMP
jgi:outer membrane protein TolC